MRGDLKVRILGALVAAAALVGPAAAEAQHHDADEIRSVIMSAYIDGLQSNGSREDIRRGFHPDFVMKVLRDGAVTSVTIEEWIGRLPPEGRRARSRRDRRDPHGRHCR